MTVKEDASSSTRGPEVNCTTRTSASPSRRRTSTLTPRSWRTSRISTRARPRPGCGPELLQRGGELGTIEVDLPLGAVDLQAQACLKQEEHRGRRPRLRADRIRARDLRPAPSGIRKIIPACGGDRSRARPRTGPSRSEWPRPFQPVSRHPRRNQGGIVRPAGADVITHGVVPRLRGQQACEHPSPRTTPRRGAFAPRPGHARDRRCR